MPEFKLFVAPGSCARVPTIALEEIGVPYDTALVRLPLDEQHTPEFLAINPKGKVPALLIDGQVLTENVAILTWLHRSFPNAKLFPKANSELETARHIADLASISGTIHPLVTRVAMSGKFVDDDTAAMNVREKAITAIKPLFQMIENRLSDHPWLYGDQWSIMDAYIFWAWWRVEVTDFPGQEFIKLKEHAARVHARPSVMRAMAFENEHAKAMRRDGLYVPHRPFDDD